MQTRTSLASSDLQSVTTTDASLVVTWSDDSTSEFPFIWLRDNDVAELHPTTRERTFDLTTVPLDIKPSDVRLDGDTVDVQWPGRDDRSRYAGDWLYRHRPGHPRHDPAEVAQVLWTAESLGEIPKFSAIECRDSVASLTEAMRTLKSVGLVIINELEDYPDAGVEFGDLIGFKRPTNFGLIWDVVSKPDPNNLAYTAVALPLHIDLTNQELVPGYQFLHCITNAADGGESIFADGYSPCAELQRQNPEYFERLKAIEIPCRFHDDTCDIRRRRPVISQDENGEFTQLVFNAHLADVPDMPTETLQQFYEAYQALMVLARSEEYRVEYTLQPGEMVIFDNRRVMHGRGAFDPSTGERQLRGYYIDRNEVDSRLRMLAKE